MQAHVPVFLDRWRAPAYLAIQPEQSIKRPKGWTVQPDAWEFARPSNLGAVQLLLHGSSLKIPFGNHQPSLSLLDKFRGANTDEEELNLHDLIIVQALWATWTSYVNVHAELKLSFLPKHHLTYHLLDRFLTCAHWETH